MELICQTCGVKFQRSTAETRRNTAKGRNVFCSRSCAGKWNVKNIPLEKRNWGHLRSDNRYDEYSRFRVFRARMSKKGKPISLTLEDLKVQWEKQDGKCPYTGWKLQTPRNTTEKRDKRLNTASLDRIDSSKGYIKGNVEFVSLIAQYAKNDFTKEQVIEFCQAVVKKN